MFETLNYHKAAHHQHNIIEHLKYQNQLLNNRNQALSLQNQKLLQELNNLHIRLQQIQNQGIQQLKKEKEIFFRQAKEINHSLFDNIDPAMNKTIIKSLQKYKFLLNSDEKSIQNIHQSLLDIVSAILMDKTNKKSTNLKSFISQAQQKLLIRRQARDLSDRKAHLIKQPHQSLLPQYKLFREELDIQKVYYQKMIIKIKRQCVNSTKIDEIIERIDQMMHLRWNYKVQQNRLTIIERQFQSGKIDTLGHTKCIDNLQRIKKNLGNLKQTLQQQFNLLTYNKQNQNVRKTLRS